MEVGGVLADASFCHEVCKSLEGGKAQVVVRLTRARTCKEFAVGYGHPLGPHRGVFLYAAKDTLEEIPREVVAVGRDLGGRS